MIEYKRHKTPLELKEYLEMLQDMGKEDYIWQQDKFGFSIFYKKVLKTRKKPVIQQEDLWYDKNLVKGLCSYAFDKDFEELYKEWREARKLSPSYKTIYDKSSEKRTFNKINKETKEVAKAMLNNAIASKWLVLYPLDEKEKTKIIQRLQEDNKKKEEISQGFKNEEEKIKALEEKSKIDKYLRNNPKMKQEALEFVRDTFPSLNEQAKNKMADTRARMEVRKLIFN